MTYTEAAALICLTFLIAHSSISSKVKHALNIDNFDEVQNDYQHFFQELFNCSLCVGFWTFYIYTSDWQWACIGSIASEITTKIINRI